MCLRNMNLKQYYTVYWLKLQNRLLSPIDWEVVYVTVIFWMWNKAICKFSMEANFIQIFMWENKWKGKLWLQLCACKEHPSFLSLSLLSTIFFIFFLSSYFLSFLIFQNKEKPVNTSNSNEMFTLHSLWASMIPS